MEQETANRLMTLIAQGQTDKAIAEATSVLQSNPNLSLVQFALGTALLKQGRIAESITALEKSAAINPALISAYSNLGSAYRFAGDLPKAMENATKALHYAKNDIMSLDNLGQCRMMVGDLAEAEQCFQTILDLNPDHVPARYSLALLYKRRGDFNNALAQAEGVIRRAPQLGDGYGLKAAILENQNRLDDAEAVLAAATAISPNHPRLMIAAGTLDFRRKRYADAIRKFTEVLKQPGDSNVTDIAVASNLLGLAYEGAGDYERAYAAFELSNTAQQQSREAQQTDKDRFLKRIDDIAAAFAAAPQERWDNDPSEDLASPVFIVGFPRSGTSLLAQILDAHPGLAVLQEEQVSILTLQSLEAVSPDQRFFPPLTKEQRRGFQQDYLNRCRSHCGELNGRIVVDKQPLNLVHAAQLLMIFPSAKFIFNLRHPNDAVFSAYKQNFLPNDSMASCYSIADAAQLYDKSLRLWRSFCERLKIQRFDLRYEHLTDSPLAATQEVAAFIGVDWSEDYLDAMANASQNQKILTPSFRQTDETIHTGSIGRWRNYASRMEPAAELLSPWITHFGYDDA